MAVNNTTDNTAKVAKEAGAIVIDVKEKVKSKGEVLRYVFKKLRNRKDIDAYISLYPVKVYKNFYEKELYNVFA